MKMIATASLEKRPFQSSWQKELKKSPESEKKIVNNATGVFQKRGINM